MEYSRKKLTDSEIFKLEAALAEKANALFSDKAPLFEELGYTLRLKFTRENQRLDYSHTGLDDAPKLVDGYMSTAVFTVLKPESDESEIYEYASVREEMDEALKEAGMLELPEEDTDGEQEENNEALLESAAELERTIAFSKIMMLRMYISFWHEKVSVCDGMDEAEKDLDSFIEKIKSKK